MIDPLGQINCPLALVLGGVGVGVGVGFGAPADVTADGVVRFGGAVVVGAVDFAGVVFGAVVFDLVDFGFAVVFGAIDVVAVAFAPVDGLLVFGVVALGVVAFGGEVTDDADFDAVVIAEDVVGALLDASTPVSGALESAATVSAAVSGPLAALLRAFATTNHTRPTRRSTATPMTTTRRSQ